MGFREMVRKGDFLDWLQADPGWKTIQDILPRFAREMAEAEDTLLKQCIEMAGYEPIPEADAEWVGHVTLAYGPGQGIKTVMVDGEPRWNIVQAMSDDGKIAVGIRAAYPL